MKIKVKFFATFRELFGAELRELELGSGTDIKELLNILCDSRRCHAAIIDSSGNLRPYIKVFDKLYERRIRSIYCVGPVDYLPIGDKLYKHAISKKGVRLKGKGPDSFKSEFFEKEHEVFLFSYEIQHK